MAFPPLVRLFLCGSLALSVAAPVFAQTDKKTVLCCEDENGRPICGDVLPSVCYGRAYREILPSGTVLRSVAAPLTPEELAKRKVQMQREKEESERAIVQRRLDRILLEMYGSVDDIDLSEKRALEDLEKDLDNLRTQELELRKKEATLQHEKQMYSGAELPQKLAQELDTLGKELVSFRTLITTKEEERKSIRERYKADRRRFVELTEQQR